jgi:hypothetical protein
VQFFVASFRSQESLNEQPVQGCSGGLYFMRRTEQRHMPMSVDSGLPDGVVNFVSNFQGDQIRRIFAYWVIVFFGKIVENYKSSPNIWVSLFQGKSVALSFPKNRLGYILADFFTKSSGHPDNFGVENLL